MIYPLLALALAIALGALVATIITKVIERSVDAATPPAEDGGKPRSAEPGTDNPLP